MRKRSGGNNSISGNRRHRNTLKMLRERHLTGVLRPIKMTPDGEAAPFGNSGDCSWRDRLGDVCMRTGTSPRGSVTEGRGPLRELANRSLQCCPAQTEQNSPQAGPVELAPSLEGMQRQRCQRPVIRKCQAWRLQQQGCRTHRKVVKRVNPKSTHHKGKTSCPFSLS